MASKIYYQHYVDGTSRQVRRATKQGAPIKADALRHRVALVAYVTQADADEVIAMARKWNMSVSAFVGLAVGFGVRHLSDSD